MSFAENRTILNDLKKFEAAIPQMVAEMGAIAHTHFTKSFSNQGFTDVNLEKWKPRKRLTYRTKRGRIVDDTTRGILIGKGTANLRKLRRVNVGKYRVDILNNVLAEDYGNVHNLGLRSGRGKGFIMPKRQYTGFSRVMSDKIENKIHSIIKRNLPVE